MRRVFALTCLALGVSTPAHALRERSFFQASRALAMGDAYTAYDNGYEAVYYNPAGVARPGPVRAKPIDLEFLTSGAAASTLWTSLTSIGGMQKLVETVASRQGETHAVGLSFLPQLLAKNFSVGLLTRVQAEARVDPATANLDMYSYTDMALYVHFGASLMGGILKVGAGVKALDRAEVNRSYTPAEYQGGGMSFGKQWQEGVGYGLDAGALITLPTTMNPTIGLAVQDLGDTTLRAQRILWTGSDGAPGAPPKLKQKVNLGFAVNPKHDRGIRSVVSVEFKDVLLIGDGALDRFHAGYELNIRESVFLRAGVNEGRYWTAGAGLRLGHMNLEFATYGENISHDPTVRVDNRNFVLRYAWGF